MKCSANGIARSIERKIQFPCARELRASDAIFASIALRVGFPFSPFSSSRMGLELILVNIFQWQRGGVLRAGIKSGTGTQGIDMSLLLYSYCSLQECANSKVTIDTTSVTPIPSRCIQTIGLIAHSIGQRGKRH